MREDLMKYPTECRRSRLPHASAICLFVAGTILGSLLPAGQCARAQGFQDLDESLEEEAVVQAKAAARQQHEIPENAFDQWVFAGIGNAQKARKRMEAQLTAKIESIDQDCNLTEAQGEKLRIAGRGDISRMFDRVEVVRKQFLATRKDQQKIQEIWQRIQPLQLRLKSGLFDDTSIIQKMLKQTLSAEQWAAYRKQAEDRHKFQHEANIALTVTMIDYGIPLLDRQRKALTKLLIDETRPPKKYGQHDFYVVLLQASKLPEEKLRTIFDDAQWRALQKPLRRAKGMERHLKQNGFLP